MQRSGMGVGLGCGRFGAACEGTVKLTKGEQLIILMLTEIQDALKIEAKRNHAIARAILEGNHWGLDRIFNQLPEQPIDADKVDFVVDVLDMFKTLEAAFARLSESDRDGVRSDLRYVHPKFIGFDGHVEHDYMMISRYLIRETKRFACFEGRQCDSHLPTAPTYRKMTETFAPIRPSMFDREIGFDEIKQVLRR